MKIAVIGGGNMGSAMVNAWLNKKICRPSDLLIFDRNFEKLKIFHSKFKIQNSKLKTKTEDCYDLKKYDVVVIAVKPQDIKKLLGEIKSHLSKKAVIVSVAAGITIKRIAGVLGKMKIVRAMPNTPAQIGMGMVGWSASSNLTPADKKTVQLLLDAMGRAIYFAQESKIDAVTAISGSGPAYVFYFMEAMFESALKIGLTAKEATVLVLGTFVGSSLLVNLSSRSPEELREMVTSKKGTTEAAIKVFDKNKLKKIVGDAVNAAYKRAGELNK
ncbi:pyrroline-5-carboxylate reductase [Patescibacteria group bacterium]|nr:pyrroline-5-carboxylate reductase [Patescibacteria group bacterium]MBU1682815.1 pyrroline-5-carboxylate reductase [Patescibacteria group bacterium]